MPGVLGGGTPLEALLGGSVSFPTLVIPVPLPMVAFNDAVAGVPVTAGFRSTGFGVVGFGELIVADPVRACPFVPIPIPVPTLVPEPEVAVALGLAMVANEPEPVLDEVVGRVIPKDPDIDRGVEVGGDKGVALAAAPVADTVGARARRGCLRPDVVDGVDFGAIVVGGDNLVVAAPDPTLFPASPDIPVPTAEPVPRLSFSTFPSSLFKLVLASRLSPPEAGGLILLLLVSL